ncbi:MAG: cytochrome c oxidase subunit I [Panacagrimonas sp.]
MSADTLPDQSDPVVRAAQEQRLLRAWAVPRGWRYWSEVNNDSVGIWYICTAFAFFLFAGVLALLMRAQLAVPENELLSARTYDQAFTLHGSAMMFLFAVPIFEAFAVLMLPQIMGTRDLPFPRLSAYGYWCFLIGGVFVCGSIFFDAAPQGGWFMYPPLTTKFSPGLGADIWLLGLSFIEISSIAAAIELIVGVLRCRPPGMRIHLMPLYGWYILVVAVMVLLAFPPLIAGDLLFEMERAFDWPFFDAARGGDPLLWQHLFWIFGHPEVYIIFLPAMALVATIVPTFARAPVAGYSWVVLSAVGTGFLSFGLWVHHMYTTGLPGISLGFFSAASEAVAIPTGIQIFCFIATFLAGRLVPSVPMLFVAGALAIFVLGGLTGTMVALAPFDFQVHDTYFVVAHLHYVLIGGMLFPVFAAIAYYFPLARSKSLSARWGKIAFWTMFTGFNLAFLPMHFTGLAGMPRRVYTYSEASGFSVLNLVSTVGAFVFATGVLIFLADVLRPRRRQALAAPNHWAAGSLEWLGPNPKPPYTPRSIPIVSSRYPLWDQPELEREVEEGRHFLPDTEQGYRETLVTSTLDAEPQQCLRVPGPSFLPMIAAILTGGVFIFATFYWWTLTLLSAVGAVAAILYWMWNVRVGNPAEVTAHVGRGVVLPLYVSGPQSVGWWAMFTLMIADGAAFLSLLFGYFFYWTVHENFPPADLLSPALDAWWVAALCVLLAWGTIAWSLRCNARSRRSAVSASLAVGALLSAAGAAGMLAGPSIAKLDPTTHVYPAMVWVLCGWCAVHLALGTLMLLFCLARNLAGWIDARHDGELINVRLYWHFAAATVMVTLAVLCLFPRGA